MKQYLDIYQSQQLTDLGVDILQIAILKCGSSNGDKSVFFNNKILVDDQFATLTIGEILVRLPININNNIRREIIGNEVKYIEYNSNNVPVYSYNFYKHDNIIDNLFDAFVWCIKNKFIK